MPHSITQRRDPSDDNYDHNVTHTGCSASRSTAKTLCIGPATLRSSKRECRPNPHRTRRPDAKQMGPVDVKGSVHTAHKQHQRICIRICARASCVDWAVKLCLRTLPGTHIKQSPKLKMFVLIRKYVYFRSLHTLLTESPRWLILKTWSRTCNKFSNKYT